MKKFFLSAVAFVVFAMIFIAPTTANALPAWTNADAVSVFAPAVHDPPIANLANQDNGFYHNVRVIAEPAAITNGYNLATAYTCTTTGPPDMNSGEFSLVTMYASGASYLPAAAFGPAPDHYD